MDPQHIKGGALSPLLKEKRAPLLSASSKKGTSHVIYTYVGNTRKFCCIKLRDQERGPFWRNIGSNWTNDNDDDDDNNDDDVIITIVIIIIIII